MGAPDYRQSACCGNCYFYGVGGLGRCNRHGGKADMLHVCADFATAKDIEGNESPEREI